jgi:SOS-response transcriptional repressor LexA
MEALSPRQAEIYQFILDYRLHKDISPTLREISDGIGLSLSSVATHIFALKDKGYVAWKPKSARSIHIIRQVAI